MAKAEVEKVLEPEATPEPQVEEGVLPRVRFLINVKYGENIAKAGEELEVDIDNLDFLLDNKIAELVE